MKAYLSAIKKSYPSSWPNTQINYTSQNYNYSILCKTTGLGAFIQLIKDIFPRVYNEENMEDAILKILEKISDREAVELFKTKNIDGSAARYAGAGALGLQNALFKELLKKYELTKADHQQSKLFS